MLIISYDCNINGMIILAVNNSTACNGYYMCTLYVYAHLSTYVATNQQIKCKRYGNKIIHLMSVLQKG